MKAVQVIEIKNGEFKTGKIVSSLNVFLPVYHNIPLTSFSSGTLSGMYDEIRNCALEYGFQDLLDALPPYPTLSRRMREEGVYIIPGRQITFVRMVIFPDKLL